MSLLHLLIVAVFPHYLDADSLFHVSQSKCLSGSAVLASSETKHSLQCTGQCVDNPLCEATSVKTTSTGHSCTLYKGEDIGAAVDDNTCTTYQRDDINVARSPGATCTASTEYPNFECTGAIDGLINPGATREWSADSPDKNNPWITVTFGRQVIVKRAVMWSRCREDEQVSTPHFETDTGETAQFNRICDGSTHGFTCTGQVEDEFLMSFQQPMSSIKLTLKNNCKTVTFKLGVREIELLGYFVL